MENITYNDHRNTKNFHTTGRALETTTAAPWMEAATFIVCRTLKMIVRTPHRTTKKEKDQKEKQSI